jgi:hypothetical protein
MTFVFNLVLVTHLLGLAAIIGGYAASPKRVSEVLVWGARAQIVTGLVLFAMAEEIHSLNKDVIMAKMIVKLVIAVAVAGFAEIARADAKRDKMIPWMPHAAGWLAIVNVCVAVLWN